MLSDVYRLDESPIKLEIKVEQEGIAKDVNIEDYPKDSKLFAEELNIIGICGSVYNTTIENVFQSKQITADKYNYYCFVCNFQTSHKKNLRYHCQKHFDWTSYSCYFCDYRTFWKGNFTKHMNIHSTERNYKCNVCEYRAVSCSNLKQHVKRVHSFNIYMCHICNFKTVDKYYLKYHIQSHMGVQQYTCYICEYETYFKPTLARHIAVVHFGSKKKNLVCYDCGHKTITKSALKKHINNHIESRDQQCKICGFMASDSKNLRSHLEQHMSYCTLCGIKLLSDISLSLHMRKHEESLYGMTHKYKCSVCDYKTAYKPQLDEHKKQFECIFCIYKQPHIRCAQKQHAEMSYTSKSN